MINVVLPVTENVKDYVKFIANHMDKNIHFLVGVRKSLAKELFDNTTGIEIRVFDDKSQKEEIINSLHSCKMQKGRILVVRRPLSDEEFDSLTNSSCEIATLKSHHNKFVSFFKNLTRKIIRKIFAFEYFQDISAICFNESMFELISVCSNLSMASRINKYVGVQIQEFETQNCSARKQYSRLKNSFWFVIGLLFMLGSVAGGILTCIFVKLQAIIVILVIFWILLSILIFGVILVNFIRTLAVGKLWFGRASEVEILKEKVEISENSTQKVKTTTAKKKTTSKSTKVAKKDEANSSDLKKTERKISPKTTKASGTKKTATSKQKTTRTSTKASTSAKKTK